MLTLLNLKFFLIYLWAFISVCALVSDKSYAQSSDRFNHDFPRHSFQKPVYQDSKPFLRDRKFFSRSLHQNDNEVIEAKHHKMSGFDDNYGSSVEWIRQYEPNDAPSQDEAAAVVIDHQGNVIVTGQSDSMLTGYDFVTVKYENSGSVLWMRRYNGLKNDDDTPVGLSVDKSDNIYVAGNSDRDYLIIKYDTNGNLKWIRRFDDGYVDVLTAIVVDSSGYICITGRNYTSWGSDYCTTIKYDANGNVVWKVRYDSGGRDYADGIAVDSSGNVFLTGRCQVLSGFDYVTVKYNKLGVFQWEKRVHSDYTDLESKIAVDNVGYIYVTGMVWEEETGYDFFTVKYDSSGNVEWSRQYDDSSINREYPISIAVDKKQNVYIAGYSFKSNLGNVYTTIKYDSSGEELWVRNHTEPDYGIARLSAMTVDKSENVHVTGVIEVSTYPHNYDFLTVKYDSAGNEIWVKRYDGSGKEDDVPASITVDNFGNIYITGASVGDGTGKDFVTIMYDPNGSEQWSQRFNGTIYSQSNAVALGIDKFGNTYVGGTSHQDYAIVKYDSSGNMMWDARYDVDKSFDILRAMAVDSSGYVYVTGGSWDSVSGYVMVTIKYSPAGELLWMSRYDGGPQDFSRAIAVDDSGNVYVTGESVGLLKDYATIKYDAFGNETWVRRYNGLGNYVDVPLAIALDKFGNVIVTGASYGDGTKYDVATIKYDKEGNEQWVRRYNDPANYYDYGMAIAVDSSCNVYVAGAIGNSYSDEDFGIIKYDSNGNELWVRSKNFSNIVDAAYVITLDLVGNVYIAGEGYCLMKYDKDGNEQWAKNLNGHSADAITVDRFGGIYVTGSVPTVSGYSHDYLTVKYDTYGTQKFALRYDGPRNSEDESSGIAVDSRGNVFVSGTTWKGYYGNFSSKGASATFSTIKYKQGLTDVTEKDAIVTQDFELYNNFPNPFNPSTTITYNLPKQSYVQLSIYDILGRKVKTLVDGEETAGTKSVAFNASHLSNGVYFYKLQAGKFTEVRKMLLMK